MVPLGILDVSVFTNKKSKHGRGRRTLIQDTASIREKAEILREKGTDRSKFFRGQIDKYTWQDYGSSYLPSDMNAAYLWAQLEIADEIQKDRMDSYEFYDNALRLWLIWVIWNCLMYLLNVNIMPICIT